MKERQRLKRIERREEREERGKEEGSKVRELSQERSGGWY